MHMAKLVAGAAIVLMAMLPIEANANGKVGVILMHGKDGTVKPRSPLGKLGGKLSGRFKVVLLDMPWSRSNRFNGTMDDAFAKIDAAVQSLKSSGVTKIVVGGHSLGANNALAYATQRTGLAGVLMIAPSHEPQRMMGTAGVLKVARANVAAGKPGTMVTIIDKYQGRPLPRNVKSSVALSWWDPNGLAVMQKTAPKMASGAPVFWVIGSNDPMQPRGKTEIYDKIPAAPKSAYSVVPGGHMSAPMKGAQKISTWLSGL